MFIGEEKIVEGPVASAEREANVVRLSLGKPPQEVIVSLVIGLLSSFPPVPESYYPGKTVRVGGKIGSFRGVPEIVVRDGADIQVIDGSAAVPAAPASTAPGASGVSQARRAPPASAAAAPLPGGTEAAAPNSSADPRIDMLLDRVRQLEERVRQLESTQVHQ